MGKGKTCLTPGKVSNFCDLFGSSWTLAAAASLLLLMAGWGSYRIWESVAKKIGHEFHGYHDKIVAASHR